MRQSRGYYGLLMRSHRWPIVIDSAMAVMICVYVDEGLCGYVSTIKLKPLTAMT